MDMRLVKPTFLGSRISHSVLLEKAPINPSHGSHRHLTLEQGHLWERIDKAQPISFLEKQLRVCIPITDRVNKLHSWNSKPLLNNARTVVCGFKIISQIPTCVVLFNSFHFISNLSTSIAFYLTNSW